MTRKFVSLGNQHMNWNWKSSDESVCHREMFSSVDPLSPPVLSSEHSWFIWLQSDPESVDRSSPSLQPVNNLWQPSIDSSSLPVLSSNQVQSNERSVIIACGYNLKSLVCRHRAHFRCETKEYRMDWPCVHFTWPKSMSAILVLKNWMWEE